MIKIKQRTLNRWILAAGLLAVSLLPGTYAGQDSQNRIAAAGAEVQASAYGAGSPAFPYPDERTSYQWALKNSGELKLVPKSAASFDEAVQNWNNGQTFGPSWGGIEAIQSVAGIDVNVLPAWARYEAKQDKRRVVVALIDSGVDYSHPDLAEAIWHNEDEIPGDGIDNDMNGFIDDVYGWNFCADNSQVYVGTEDNHGTHSAGTIAASRNGIGTVGICDPAYVKVMVLKVLETNEGVGTASNVIRAIQYAEANGAEICNLSFGTSVYSEQLYETIRNSKMLFVVAAGNGDGTGQGYDIDAVPVYPAAFELDNVIAVSNLQFDGSLDPESKYGLQSIDLAAPGSYILSTVSGGGYNYMSGTSMAAPMVTATAAMMYSYDPNLTLPEIKGRILSSVRPLESLRGRVATGGILDISAALSFSP